MQLLVSRDLQTGPEPLATFPGIVEMKAGSLEATFPPATGISLRPP